MIAMASGVRGASDDARRAAVSPRPKGRENAKDTLCKNVTIYGHCRYENKGCVFNHNPVKAHNATDSTKKRFNVDSPSFTPTQNGASLAVNGGPTKSSGLSPKAANAAPFKPKGLNSGSNDYGGYGKKQYNPAAPDWSMAPSAADVAEFLPQSHGMMQAMGDPNGSMQQGIFDPYMTSPSPLPSTNQGPHQAQINPYAQDPTTTGNTSYYQANSFTQPLQYHLYTSLGPHRENLLPYQRAAHDFFIPDNLREDLQRKSAATQQTLPNSTLPPQIDYFHSLVPLDTSNQKNTALFGYPSWIYKAISSKDGNTYALRRLEGYRLTNEKAIRAISNWKRVNSGNVVTVIDAFTNRSFGDSSLMIVTDYHPLSKTLAEIHPTTSRYSNRNSATHVTEQVLWAYLVQIANALRIIHGTGLAARVIDATKILLTNKNRIRLNACGILDIIQFDTPRPIQDLQREDMVYFGHLILSLGTNTSGIAHNLSKAMEQFARSYSTQLKDRVFWLVSMMHHQKFETIDAFTTSIEGQTLSAFDSQEQLNDQLMSELNRELENSRIVRLMMKLNFITERPDYSHDRQWAETGERFPIKLFRDYVFHQVDAQGNPVLDMGHVLACLNKLDAGSEEKVVLTSRDDQIVIVVSYKEMKRAIDGAFGDLVRASRR